MRELRPIRVAKILLIKKRGEEKGVSVKFYGPFRKNLLFELLGTVTLGKENVGKMLRK